MASETITQVQSPTLRPRSTTVDGQYTVVTATEMQMNWISADKPPVADCKCIVYVPFLDRDEEGDDGVLPGYWIANFREFRIVGSPSKWEVAYWMPWPGRPVEYSQTRKEGKVE